jgi:hypothetical protein
MKKLHTALALAGVLLAAGCTPGDEFEPGPARTRPNPYPSASEARAGLVTALQRLTGGPVRFTVTGGAPEGGTITASGGLDPAGKRYEVTLDITGTTPVNTKRVIVGTDCYVWQPEQKIWVRLDTTRMNPTSIWYVDTADPTGLTAFLTGVSTALPVRHTADGWAGELNADKVRNLPLGAPSFERFSIRNLPFTVTADAQGSITTITMQVEVASGPKITWTTTFTGHGAPAGINVPPKGSVREADDLYYNK